MEDIDENSEQSENVTYFEDSSKFGNDESQVEIEDKIVSFAS